MRRPKTPRRGRGRRRVALLTTGSLFALTGGAAAYADLAKRQAAGPQGDGTAYTSTGWHVTPAGMQTTVGERPFGMSRSPDGTRLLISNAGLSKQSVMLLDAATGKVLQTIQYLAPEAVSHGVAWSGDGRRAYVTGGTSDRVRVYDVGRRSLTERAPIRLDRSGLGAKASVWATGLSASPDGKQLWVTEGLINAVAVVDLSSGRQTRVALRPASCPVNVIGSDPSLGRSCDFPYTVVFDRAGTTAYVSSWGQNYVTAIDAATRTVRAKVKVGTHPTAMVASPVRDELYVANTDSDSLAVVNTRTTKLARTVSVSPYPGAAVGTQPNALAVSGDGSRLYVANAGNNDIDVVSLATGGEPDRLLGLIPTGWYPTGIAVSGDDRTMYVANAKGLGAGPNPRGPVPTKDRTTPPNQYIGSMIEGTVSTIAVPTRSRLTRMTRQVIDNNGFAQAGSVRRIGAAGQTAVPTRVGGASPVKHVIYVVNENRTYDQVLGDLGKGNGDPSLTLFDRRSTPNHHALAERFGVLDNLYAAGDVSMDGWEWSTGANASRLDNEIWVTNYGDRGLFYAGEGGSLSAAPGMQPKKSYIWDALHAKGLSYRNYGFWASGDVPSKVANEPILDANTDHRFPGYNLAIPDQVRYAEWLREFRGYEKRGNLPSVQFVKFPRDHTCGTRANCPTPQAMMADSDFAFGKLVDTVSHSKYWASTAIFQIEDDAQNGPDHVDGHRTIGHVISPYTSTGGKVDSTFYSSTSMLRTMELILGLRPLTQFDAASIPLYNSFAAKPDLRPYNALAPKQRLDEPNPTGAPLQRESSEMDFTAEDRAPEGLLNQAIWKSVKGANSEMPLPRRFGQDTDG